MAIKMIKRGNISSDGKRFTMYMFGTFHRDIQRDLIKNKKIVLEAIATHLLFPTETKPRKFRDTKPKLVEKILPLLQFEEDDDDPDDWELICVGDDFSVPAGKYYVGDLCYDMKDIIYDDIWGKKFNYQIGLYRRKSDGAVFGMFSTGGDGLFKGRNTGEEYGVDAGILGIASSVLCYGNDKHIDFAREVKCSTGRGKYNFGHIEISEFWGDEEEDGW